MRRAILAAGLLLVVIGLAAMVNGWSIILVERGWAQFIAGSMLLSAGAILAAISEVVARLDTVTQGAARPARRPAAPALVQPPMIHRPPQNVPEALPSPQGMPVPMPTAIPAPLPPFVPSTPASEAVSIHAPAAEAPPPPEPVQPEPAPVEPPVPAIEPAQKGRIGIGALAGAAAVGATIFGRRLETAVKPAEPTPAPEPVEALPEALHDQPVVAEHLPEPAAVEAPTPIQTSTIDPSEALKRLEAEIGGALFGTMPAAPLQEKPEEKPEEKLEEKPEELRDAFDQKREEKLPEDQQDKPQDEPRDEPDQKPDLFAVPPVEPVAHDPLPPPAPEPVEHTAHETIAVEDVRLVEEAAPPPVEPALAALPQTEEVDELAWLDAALRGIELPKEPEWVTRPEPVVDTAPVAEPVQPATPVSPPDHAAIMRSIEERLEHALLDDLPEAAPAPHEAAAAPEPQPEESHPIVDPVPEHVPEAIAEPPATESEVAAVEPAQEPEAVAEPDPTIVRRYESQGVVYTLYDNGSVDAETPSGVFHFKSLDELREFLAKPA